tara:strand:+ start:7288 stop:7518 length:231 start_codon:yes stop_codon:yes gene_type:complete
MKSIQVNKEQFNLLNKWGRSIVALSKKGFLNKLEFPIHQSEELLNLFKDNTIVNIAEPNLVKNKDNPVADVIENEN